MTKERDTAKYKNRINVFYVTIPSEEGDSHTFVTTVNIKKPEKKVQITMYVSLLNIDDSEMFVKLRYSLSGKDEDHFSDFTDPIPIEKVPDTTFTSFNLSAEFLLQIDKIICFEIQLSKKEANGTITTLDSKQCYVNVELKEDDTNAES